MSPQIIYQLFIIVYCVDLNNLSTAYQQLYVTVKSAYTPHYIYLIQNKIQNASKKKKVGKYINFFLLFRFKLIKSQAA